MDLRTLLFLKAASGGESPEIGYSHENVKKLVFIGNQYAWQKAQFTNKPNLITLPETDKSSKGVRFVTHDNIVTINGNAEAANDFAIATIEQQVLAGTYTITYYPYVGVSGPDAGRNMYVDFFNDASASSYTQRVRLESVKDSAVSATFTLEENMAKFRVWVGNRQTNYEDYRIFITMFESDVLISNLNEDVPSDGTYTFTFGTAQSFVYTMQHKTKAYK